MKRIRVLMVASALSLTFALTLLAIWAITQTQGGWIPSQRYALLTNGGRFQFFVPAGQIANPPGFPKYLIMYREVLSFPLWPAIGVGLVLPIICACFLITGKLSTTRGFEVGETAPRPPTVHG